MTTSYAAIDTGTLSGAVYGVGDTREAALADAERGAGPGGEPAPEFAVVPISAAARALVEDRGGAPGRDLVVTSRRVTLLAEET